MQVEALQFSSFEIKFIPSSGREGLTAKFVVVNRAQRCEQHKLAVFLVGGGGEVLCADLMLVAILVKCESARNFQRPPSHPALLDSVYFDGVQVEALQFSSFEIKFIPSSGRAGGSH